MAFVAASGQGCGRDVASGLSLNIATESELLRSFSYLNKCHDQKPDFGRQSRPFTNNFRELSEFLCTVLCFNLRSTFTDYHANNVLQKCRRWFDPSPGSHFTATPSTEGKCGSPAPDTNALGIEVLCTGPDGKEVHPATGQNKSEIVHLPPLPISYVAGVGRPCKGPSIKTLTRPNGRVVFRVLATVQGKQLKKIVPTRDAAELLATKWREGQANNLVLLPTRFAPDQLRDAEAAQRMVQTLGISRIRADNLGERIPMPEGRDELAALVRLLNRMFDRLESSFAQVKRFTADASHELKTPLTFVRLNAEKLRTKYAIDPEATAVIEDILEELDHLGQIIESLLFLAKAESGALVLSKTEAQAERFVEEFAEDAVALAEDRGAKFALVRADSGRIFCEQTLVRQLLTNLATNAIRVSPPGGTVTLESCVSEGRWRLLVTDQGPGLPPDQLEPVFERFQRYGPTSGKTGIEAGAGLGLAICRSIATLHGGTIHAENGAAGFCIVVELPV